MSNILPLIQSDSDQDSDQEASITYSIPGLNYPSAQFKITHRRFSNLSRDGECPSCNVTDYDERYYPDARTWTLCGGACVLGCWFGMCLIPLLWNKVQEKEYYCKVCQERLDLGIKRE